MLTFSSFFSTSSSSLSAVAECVEKGLVKAEPRMVFFHATIGHNLTDLTHALRDALPECRVCGCTCAGIITPGQSDESMQALAIMAIQDPDHELAIAFETGIDGARSYETGVKLGARLRPSAPRQVLLYTPGMDVAGDELIRGIESELGDIPIFGAYSSDNMQAIKSFQIVDDTIEEKGTIAVGLCDPSLSMVAAATHGFPCAGEPGVVTRSTNNWIEEIDGEPAWHWFTSRLGMSADVGFLDTIPVGALAEALPAEAAAEYDNEYILRVITARNEAGAMAYPVNCPVGTEVCLTRRDEEEIFAKMERTVRYLLREMKGRTPVAVFHADCGARGRMAFGRVHKEEIIAMMQEPIFEVSPCAWIGLYGLGELCPLGGRNVFHNYSTALGILVRDG